MPPACCGPTTMLLTLHSYYCCCRCCCVHLSALQLSGQQLLTVSGVFQGLMCATCLLHSNQITDSGAAATGAVASTCLPAYNRQASSCSLFLASPKASSAPHARCSPPTVNTHSASLLLLLCPHVCLLFRPAAAHCFWRLPRPHVRHLPAAAVASFLFHLSACCNRQASSCSLCLASPKA
jgi:hypothetical protein